MHRKSRRQREPKEEASRKERCTERVGDRENLKRKRSRKERCTERVGDRDNLKRKRVERNDAQKE